MINGQFQEHYPLPEATYRALENVDGMSEDMRQCVHEFGYQIVKSFLNQGITKPNLIRSLVHTCWMGAREPHQRHGLHIKRSPVADHLDWLLVQAGAQITAATLLQVLLQHNMVIVPREPSTVMVSASMDAVKTIGTVSKEQKHRHRLRAAILASTQRLWPQSGIETKFHTSAIKGGNQP